MTGSATLTQNHGAGDTIRVDQLMATNPGSSGPTGTCGSGPGMAKPGSV